ncbi:hypothetical protein BKA58DRAFT_458891 [Alternaria rosae]|uniref:uncharacterized protein n=1 Tax=Alternaria rosae TaxID=1187941 RepID=UPI001E8CFD29|nr:uncharacterized protein BKA58DRAFT_458891 [Alternaria rosae]KAH6868229.1 hypothetical protein BKA58DRAFT_458891 [Alternaria rosae]
MYETSPFKRHKRNTMRGYEWPAFDLGGFGGHGGIGGLGGYAAWNTGFDTPYYDVPGSVEQATRSHVEAQTEFEKAKEKYEEAKKKFEECEKKVEKAEQMLNLAKHRAGCWWN